MRRGRESRLEDMRVLGQQPERDATVSIATEKPTYYTPAEVAIKNCGLTSRCSRTDSIWPDVSCIAETARTTTGLHSLR